MEFFWGCLIKCQFYGWDLRNSERWVGSLKMKIPPIWYNNGSFVLLRHSVNCGFLRITDLGTGRDSKRPSCSTLSLSAGKRITFGQ